MARRTAPTASPIERVRSRCMALPEVVERISHGEPTWFVRGKKTFVMSADHHHDDRVAIWCAADRDERDALVAERPRTFFVPPYVGGRGWLGVYLDEVAEPVADDELDELIESAFRCVAPRTLLARLDADAPSAE